MSYSEYEWGRDQARSGGWRNDFSAAEAAGYDYQRSVDESERRFREQQAADAEEAARRSRQSQGAAADAGWDWNANGTEADGGGDVVSLVILGGVAFVVLLPLIIGALVLVAICLGALYAYDLARHRAGLRPLEVVLGALAQDRDHALRVGLRWLAARCRSGAAMAGACAGRLQHRAMVADSLPTRLRSPQARKALALARRGELRVRRLLVQAGAGLQGLMARGLEWAHDAV